MYAGIHFPVSPCTKLFLALFFNCVKKSGAGKLTETGHSYAPLEGEAEE
jgi:hypothetical protein